VFNPHRCNDSYVYKSSVFSHSVDRAEEEHDLFEPARDLVFTEAKLKEFLINVTISALSLNTSREKIPVNTTEYLGTYHFSQRINLVLPYALCLAFTLAFAGIGTWSLLQNGTSAVDGGFMEVMMATRGRTEMEELVLKHGTRGKSGSRELLDLEIRYGELLDAEGLSTGRAAFGMVVETRLLRKAWMAV
jgi:hypothetical protein